MLRLDWASRKAASFACRKWHYSRRTPPGKKVVVGVWEDGRFIGTVVYSPGSSSKLGAAYGLEGTEVCELTRVALRSHRAPVSRILAISLKFLRKRCPGIRLVVSFADPREGHIGTIYQAAGWTYTGRSQKERKYIHRRTAREYHNRSVSACGTVQHFDGRRRAPKPSDCIEFTVPGKYRYVKVLDRRLEAVVAKLAKPYPKE